MSVYLFKAADTVNLAHVMARNQVARHVWSSPEMVEIVVGRGSAIINGETVEERGWREHRLPLSIQALEDITEVMLVCHVDDLGKRARHFGGETFAGVWRDTLGPSPQMLHVIDEDWLVREMKRAAESNREYEIAVGLREF